jgi:hypothetical protein
MKHLAECRACPQCGVHACYHLFAYRNGTCWVDVRGEGCGEQLHGASRTATVPATREVATKVELNELCVRCHKWKAKWLTGHGRLCGRCRNYYWKRSQRARGPGRSG